VHEHFNQVELEELRKNMVRSYERWYYGYGQRARRFFERTLYYIENPHFGKKRLGRALGLVPPPKSAMSHLKSNGTSLMTSEDEVKAG
jgi:hypothetical protein